MDVLKPIVLDKPFIDENFNFPRFNDLKTFEPLMENRSVSKNSDFSLCCLGFVSPVKYFLPKDKGYFLRSCSKNVGTGVLNKAQSGVLMRTNNSFSVFMKNILFLWNPNLGHLEQKAFLGVHHDCDNS